MSDTLQQTAPSVDPMAIMQQAARGKYQYNAPVAQPASDASPDNSSIPMMVIRPGPTPDSTSVDPMSIMQQAVKGQFKYQAPPVDPSQSTLSGIGKNVAAGLQEGAAGTMNVLSDPFGNLVGKPLLTAGGFVHDALAPAFGYQRLTPEQRTDLLGDDVPQPGTRLVNAFDQAVGMPTPDHIPANGTAEQLVRKGVGAATSMAGLGPGGPLLNAAMGAGGAIAGDQAAHFVPEWAQPMTELAGNVLGNLGAAGVANLGGKLVNSGLRTFGNLGIGPKETIGGTRATGTQIENVGNKVMAAAGPEGQAAIESATAQPGMGAPTNGELVEGAKPTTAQIAPTPGLVEMEKASRVANPAEFNALAASQNNARVGAIRGLAPEDAEPALLGQHFTQMLQDIDARHAQDTATGASALTQEGEEATQQARGAVQAATQTVVGQTPPDVTGEAVRSSLMERNQAAKAAEGKLWQSIDPEGKLTLPLGDVQQTAQSLMKEINPNLGDVLGPQESLILKGAAALPDVVPFAQAQRLRSNIGFAERMLRATPGNEQSLRRLGMLKSSLDDAIANGVDAAGGTAGQAGLVDEQGAVGHPGSGVREPLPGSNSGPATAPGLSERIGIQNEGGQGERLAAGNSPVAAPAAIERGASVNGEITPNFDADAAARYAAARQATLERKQTFGQGPVGAVLRPGRRGAEFNVENAAVARQFLTGNSTEPGRVQSFISAVGGEPQATAAMQDALVGDLRQRRIINEEGMVQPDKLKAWLGLEARGRTVDLFPGLRDQLGTAEAAQRTYDQTVADHGARLDAFNKQAAADHIAEVGAFKKTGGQFASADPEIAFRRLLASDTPAKTFTDVVNQAKSDPKVLDGLKRLAADYIEQKFSGAKPSGDDTDFLRSDQFRKFIDARREPLKVIFGGQGLQNLEMVAADLRRQAMAAAAPATPGPDTAQKTSVIRKERGEGFHATALAVIGEQIGDILSHVGGHEGIAGKVIGAGTGLGGFVLHAMKQAGISTKSDLIREAMLNPAVAKELMTRAASRNAISQMSQRRIARAIQASIVNNAVGQSNQEPKQ